MIGDPAHLIAVRKDPIRNHSIASSFVSVQGVIGDKVRIVMRKGPFDNMLYAIRYGDATACPMRRHVHRLLINHESPYIIWD